MCGRFKLESSAETLYTEFGIDPPADLVARYNIAPTQPVLAVLRDGDRWRAALLRWGLVPHWESDPKSGARRINARAETLLAKPSFRDAFQSRRCLIPADGFYEWLRTGRARVPMLIRRPDARPFAFAGLWECWKGGEDRPFSCTIITAPPTPLLATIHARMPLILPPLEQQQWLDPATPIDQLVQLMRPYA